MEKTARRTHIRPGRTIVSGDVEIHCESVKGQIVRVLVVSPYHTKVIQSDLDIPDRKDNDSR